MIIIGIIIIICSLIFTGWALVTNKSKTTGLVIFCLLGIFIGIVLIFNERATEIVVKDIGTIKIAKKSAQADAKAVDELRKRIESEAIKIQEVKERLYSMFKLNASGSIDPLRPMNFDFWEFVADAGIVTAMDLPVTSEAPRGSQMGYVFRVGSNNILGIISEADGTGGVENKKIFGYVDLEMKNSDNGIIFKSQNGYRWKLAVDNDGTLRIRKI